ncbi:MAG: transcription elongation factor GreA [Lachnospiraceae bacterium]|nr:transcription elongation factor GreA [Lachnospiraceae bacterium]
MKMTRDDIRKIQEEIDYRQTELRRELLENLKTARAQGDLSENFEYTMAKRANNQNNSRVRYLEKLIRTAEIIEDHSSADEVGLNKAVTVYFPEDDEEEVFKIVTSIRGDSTKGRISDESPLGKSLMGHKAGDTVIVKVNDEYSYPAVIRKIENADNDNADPIRQY